MVDGLLKHEAQLFALIHMRLCNALLRFAVFQDEINLGVQRSNFGFNHGCHPSLKLRGDYVQITSVDLSLSYGEKDLDGAENCPTSPENW